VSTRVLQALRQHLPELRYEPTAKRVRAELGGETVLDSERAILLWEPRRVVPEYAVPDDDVTAELVPSAAEPVESDAPFLHPGIPFLAHTSEGEPLDVRAGGETREAAAFRLADADLAGYVLFEFDAFDAWYEEDEPAFSHPRDPFHRVDTRRSSRHVRVELDGRLLADSTRPTLLFETGLGTRYYLPREDVVADLAPSETRTGCPYKGAARYWSVGDEKDIAWTYEHPLPDAVEIAGMIAFYNERVKLSVD